MSRFQVEPPSDSQILSVILAVLGIAVAVPVGLFAWVYISWQHGDAIVESLGLITPDEHCMLESWEPEHEFDADPRQFCNTTLKRNHGSVVDLARKQAAAEEAAPGRQQD